MRFMISGQCPTVEQLLADDDVVPYLGAMVTPNTGNSVDRICGWSIPWCVDNGAFPGKKGFNPAQFMALAYRASVAPDRPVFVAVPDHVELVGGKPVGDHKKTLKRFYQWVDKLLPLDVPLAFVAQDGMGYYDIEDDIPWPLIRCVFVGGSDEFKDEMTMYIAEACRERGKWCHLGRVNGYDRIRLAVGCDVDSVDGTSLSMYAKTYARKYAGWVREFERESCWLEKRNEEFEFEHKMWSGPLSC